jgi:hypothetical protein
MAMKFGFLSPDLSLQGASVELHVFSQSISIPRIYHSPVSSNMAIFQIDPAKTFAFLVRANNEVIARSGMTGLASGKTDDFTGDFESYYLIQPTDSPIVISLEEFRDSLPETPQTFNDENGNPIFRVDELNLDIIDDRLVSTGAGEYLGGGAGNLTFTYEFRLDPDRDIRLSNILRVVTVASAVRSVNTGFWGAIRNFFTNIMLRMLRNRLSNTFREIIQGIVNQEINDQIEKEAAEREVDPDEFTVTVRSISISSAEGVTVNPVIMVNLTCPAQTSSEKDIIKARSKNGFLNIMRDRVFPGSEKGDRYLKLFNDYRFELTNLLVTQPEILRQAEMTFKSGRHDIPDNEPEKVIMSVKTIEEADHLLKMIAGKASPGLAFTANDLAREIKDFTGKPLSQILDK